MHEAAALLLAEFEREYERIVTKAERHVQVRKRKRGRGRRKGCTSHVETHITGHYTMLILSPHPITNVQRPTARAGAPVRALPARGHLPALRREVHPPRAARPHVPRSVFFSTSAFDSTLVVCVHTIPDSTPDAHPPTSHTTGHCVQRIKRGGIYFISRDGSRVFCQRSVLISLGCHVE